MAYMNPIAIDKTLEYISQVGVMLHLCEAIPTTYAEVLSTALAAAAVVVGAPEDDPEVGRKVVIPAVVDQPASKTGEATHWALTDNQSILVCTNKLIIPEPDVFLAIAASGTFSTEPAIITLKDFVSA